MLGGGVGDAMGAPVEFLSLTEIRAAFGPDGLAGYAPAYGRTGAITDDTQMTLFTAEGLLRTQALHEEEGVAHPPSILHRSYLRWLHTQGHPGQGIGDRKDPDGWLITQPVLHHRRSPGNTCLAALRSGRMGSLAERLNDSKGCGGVMRVAPIGLVAAHPLVLGVQAAAITHGHPSGYLAAGAFARIIAGLHAGGGLRESIEETLEVLGGWPDHEETTVAVRAAIDLADNGPPTPDRVEQLGGGWVAEEALAIGVYCALTAPDFRTGILAAVNHSGDSDSTGAITGNLLGALLGEEAIPSPWTDELEAHHLIAQIADDLIAAFVQGASVDSGRYPTW